MYESLFSTRMALAFLARGLVLRTVAPASNEAYEKRSLQVLPASLLR
jgi:hypothetical protein